MKNTIACITTPILFILTSVVYAQQYYVVVGTFTEKKGAEKFIGYVQSKHYNADYEMDAQKKYYYVYVMKTADRATGFAETRRLQAETEFKDVWLFSDQTGRVHEDPKDEIKTEVIAKPTVISEPKDTIQTVAAVSVPTPPMENKTEVKKVRGRLFKFTIQTQDGKSLHSEVHDVNYRRGHHLATYKSDEYVDLLKPAEDNNPMTFVCGIFGYKEVVKVIDYNNPSSTEGATKDDKGAWIIPYHLERLKKGDVSVMYHVFFHKDAVVMLPDAKTEMDELVNMMKDNLNYKIKIHGHCNGNNSRRIIALGKNKNYFNIKGSDERQGTAKELSKLRAEAIQSYLVESGIDIKRTSIYAWGALNMLTPETGASAKLNDRIEIEIEED